MYLFLGVRVYVRVDQAGRRFRVILADARPQLEGQRMLKRLIKRGIPTTYALLNALSCLISVTPHPPEFRAFSVLNTVLNSVLLEVDAAILGSVWAAIPRREVSGVFGFARRGYSLCWQAS